MFGMNLSEISCYGIRYNGLLHLNEESRLPECKISNWIEKWWEMVDSDLEAARLTPHKLEMLKETAGQIWKGKKILLLQNLAENEGRLTPEAQKWIERLQTCFQRILYTPFLQEVEQVAPPPPVLFARSCLFCGKKKKWPAVERPLSPRSLRDWRKKEDGALKREQQAQNASFYAPKWKRSWKSETLNYINKLEDPDAVIAFGRQATSLQALEGVKDLLANKQMQKLAVFAGSLPFRTLDQLLPYLEEEVLGGINRAFRQAETKLRFWLNREPIIDWSDGFAATINNIDSEIDALAKELRHDDSGESIKQSDLQKIDAISDKIKRKRENLIRLMTLLKQTVSKVEYQHLIYIGLDKKLRELETRADEKHEYEGRPAGCLWSIIYRNVFVQNDVDNEDDPFEIFSAWKMVGPQDYRRYGLFGTISNAEYSLLTLKKTEVSGEIRSPVHYYLLLAKENLKLVGIEKTVDYKKHNIFNQYLLNAYLNRPVNLKKINENTQKFLKSEHLDV